MQDTIATVLDRMYKEGNYNLHITTAFVTQLSSLIFSKIQRRDFSTPMQCE